VNAGAEAKAQWPFSASCLAMVIWGIAQSLLYTTAAISALHTMIAATINYMNINSVMNKKTNNASS
jgi:hypothetical protein